MSMFSDWTSKAKTYYDEKVKPKGGTAKEYADKGEQIAKDVNKTYRQMQYTYDALQKGPKGSTGQFVRGIYGGSFKDVVKQMQGKANETASSGSSASEDEALAELYRSSRRGVQGRNRSGSSESEDQRRSPYAMNNQTLLTQGQRAKKITGQA